MRTTVAVFAVCLAWPALASDEAGSVTVYRDDYGVPYIFAATDADAAYGLGYAQAEDRLGDLSLDPQNFEVRLLNTLRKATSRKTPDTHVIVLSHFPPYGILDTTSSGRHVGNKCFSRLLETLFLRTVIVPLLAAFGDLTLPWNAFKGST